MSRGSVSTPATACGPQCLLPDLPLGLTKAIACDVKPPPLQLPEEGSSVSVTRSLSPILPPVASPQRLGTARGGASSRPVGAQPASLGSLRPPTAALPVTPTATSPPVSTSPDSCVPALPLLGSQQAGRLAAPLAPPPPAAASTSIALQPSPSAPRPRTPPTPHALLRRGSTRTGLYASAPAPAPASAAAPTPVPGAAAALAPARTATPVTSMLLTSLVEPIIAPAMSFTFSTAPSPAPDAAAAAAIGVAADGPLSSSGSPSSGGSTASDGGASSSSNTSPTPPGNASVAGVDAGADGTARGASVDPREAAKFAALAASWWRTTDGPFAPLHALNPARVLFIRRSLAAMMGLDAEAPQPLDGLRVLDVGCGGGILSEALARLGAQVHGIDVTRENVEVARLHARADPRVAARVRYDVISAEDLAASGTAPYDVVIASEVLEHVNRPHQLLPVLTSLLAPSAPGKGRPAGGALVVSTLNRTAASYAVAIVGAEYVTGVVPRGTHQWRKFFTPEELAVMADACGLQVWHAAGMAPSGPRMAWQLGEDLSVNYIATLRRRERPLEQPSVQQPAEPVAEAPSDAAAR